MALVTRITHTNYSSSPVVEPFTHLSTTEPQALIPAPQEPAVQEFSLLDSLPEDVLLLVGQYLSATDLCRVRQCNRYLRGVFSQYQYKILDDPRIQRHLSLPWYTRIELFNYHIHPQSLTDQIGCSQTPLTKIPFFQINLVSSFILRMIQDNFNSLTAPRYRKLFLTTAFDRSTSDLMSGLFRSSHFPTIERKHVLSTWRRVCEIGDDESVRHFLEFQKVKRAAGELFLGKSSFYTGVERAAEMGNRKVLTRLLRCDFFGRLPVAKLLSACIKAGRSNQDVTLGDLLNHPRFNKITAKGRAVILRGAFAQASVKALNVLVQRKFYFSGIKSDQLFLAVSQGIQRISERKKSHFKPVVDALVATACFQSMSSDNLGRLWELAAQYERLELLQAFAASAQINDVSTTSLSSALTWTVTNNDMVTLEFLRNHSSFNRIELTLLQMVRRVANFRKLTRALALLN